MQEVKTYLELSEAGGGSHKSYEAVVSGNQLAVGFGRIGEAGQMQTKEFADAALAPSGCDDARSGYSCSLCHAVSAGFDQSWHCQFPKGIRADGVRYVVDEVRESRNGFYRVFGNIKKLNG